MRIVIAGAHGQVARRLGRALSSRGDTVVGVIRNADQAADLRDDGVEPAVFDLVTTPVHVLADALAGADAVVFAAGAGAHATGYDASSVDRAGAVRLADAAEVAGVARYLMLSGWGVDAVANGATPAGTDPVFADYLRAKLAADDDLRARSGLAWTVLRPVALTDEPGRGRVQLGSHVPHGSIPRDDVAAVLVALLDHPRPGAVLELAGGPTPVAEAVRVSA